MERLKPGARLVVATDVPPSLQGELISADPAGLTIRGPGAVAERVARAAVVEIRDATRRGSKPGAIVGAGAGAFLGYLMSLNLAFRDCGGNCSDERVLIGVALVGTPVAGGFLGYHAFGRRNQVVYRRSPP